MPDSFSAVELAAEIETAVEALQDARKSVEQVASRLRELEAEKLAVEAVVYTRDELAAAEKRLVQRTMFLAAQRPVGLAS